MKLIFLVSIFATLSFEFNKVRIANELKIKAEKACKNKQYLYAIRYYDALLNTYKVQDENLLLDLANAYYKIGDLSTASKNYTKLTYSSYTKMRSIAAHQLGVIAAFQKNNKKALSWFRLALKAWPENEAARYNYELISKKINDNPSYAGKGNKKDQSGKTEKEMDEIAPSGNFSLPRKPAEKEKSPTSSAPLERPATLPQPDKENKEKNNDLLISQGGQEDANALQTVKFNEIHISEAKAEQILNTMKEQEFMLLYRMNDKNNTNKSNKNQQDW